MKDYTKLIEGLQKEAEFDHNHETLSMLLCAADAIGALQAKLDAYQKTADKMAAEHRVEREALERQIKIKDGEAEMYKSYWKQATDANRRIRNDS